MSGTAEGEELSLEVEHPLLFGNTLNLAQVMLTKKKSYEQKPMDCVCTANQHSWFIQLPEKTAVPLMHESPRKTV